MADTKVCNKCKEEQTLENFSPNKSKPQGVKYTCKRCSAVLAKERRSKFILSESQAEAARERSRKWRLENPELAKQVKQKSVAKRPFIKAAASARYRASKSSATPSWLTDEQRKQIEYFYQHTNDLLCVTGEMYHVDHIVPLKGTNVCGLHVPWNLQVLPADINCIKSNTYNGW